jgi:hypothetical protein
VCRIADKTLSRIRIAQAYIRLLCIPGDGAAASVSLVRIGRCEIRFFGGAEANADGMPLIWLELFDHGTKTSVDSFSCYEIDEAVTIFEDFIVQAGLLNGAPGPDDSDTQG